MCANPFPSGSWSFGSGPESTSATATALRQFDGLIINTGDRTVSFNRRYGEFSRIEFDILAFLARHPNRIYSYEQLYDNIWNEPLNESRHNVQARIASVRQKLFDLCPGKEYIQTVRRKGYQFVP